MPRDKLNVSVFIISAIPVASPAVAGWRCCRWGTMPKFFVVLGGRTLGLERPDAILASCLFCKVL